MPVNVLIPTPLRKLTDNHDVVTVEASTVEEMMNALDTQFPGLGGRLKDENGVLRRFINVYVNDEDIRFLQNKDTALKDGDSVSIVPAIAGG